MRSLAVGLLLLAGCPREDAPFRDHCAEEWRRLGAAQAAATRAGREYATACMSARKPGLCGGLTAKVAMDAATVKLQRAGDAFTACERSQ